METKLCLQDVILNNRLQEQNSKFILTSLAEDMYDLERVDLLTVVPRSIYVFNSLNEITLLMYKHDVIDKVIS